MKNIILASFAVAALATNAQLIDGTYKYAKITVSGGVITGVDSLVEYDPTVSIDVKNITTMDQNHWNDAYLRVYDYPSYSYLDYLINHVWIPQTTDNLSEGSTNLYFSTTRFDSRFNLKTTDNLGEGLVNKYFSNSLARGAFSVSSPLSYNSVTGSFGIQQATSSQSGYLSSIDFNTFNNKQALLASGTNIKTINGASILGSGDLSVTATLPSVGTSGTYGQVTTDAQGRVTSGKRLEAYSGTTAGSGTYTVTYAAAYSTVPNVQPVIRNQSNPQQFCALTSSTTTGFTVTVYQRNTVTLLSTEVLLGAVTTTNGLVVDVMVTER